MLSRFSGLDGQPGLSLRRHGEADRLDVCKHLVEGVERPSLRRLRDQPPKIGQSAKKRYEFAPTDAQYQTVRSCLNCVSAGPGRCPKTNKHRAWLQPIDPFQARVQPSENSAGRPGRRFGRPCPMALECLADSRANYFATADLTLMRSLRIKKLFWPEKWGRTHCVRSAANRPTLFINPRSGTVNINCGLARICCLGDL